MSEKEQSQVSCPKCGHEHATPVEVCERCGAPIQALDTAAENGDWSRVRDSLKLRWVAAVLAFWISAGVLLVVYVLQGRLDLILVSICLGLLLVGLWLKTQYQRHEQNNPTRL